MTKETNNKAIARTRRLEARVTETEYGRATELAEICGLSLSDYIRRVALGQHPRQRLSPEEVEALKTLADSRGDLKRIVTAIRAIKSTERGKYFVSTDFVKNWMTASLPLIERLTQILEYTADE